MFTQWDGKPFTTAQLALQVVDQAEDGNCIAAAFDGKRGVLLSAHQVGIFLDEHQECELLVHDAARVHWTLHRLLSFPRQPEAIEALWSLSRSYRFLDVMLLEQRIRGVLERRYALPKELCRLTEQYCAQESDVEPVELVSSRLCSEAIAIHRVYYSFTSSDRYTWLIGDSANKSGPLGIGIDVQGAIAVSQDNAGIAIDHVTRRQLIEACEGRYAAASHVLYEDTLTRNCFEWERTTVARDRKGYPRWDEKLLRSRLSETLNQLRDLNGRPFMPLWNDRGIVSLSPEHWEPFTDCVPRLKAWANLTKAAAAIRYFQAISQNSFRPKYCFVPYLRAYEPPLTALERFGLPKWRPLKGHCCRVTIVELELQCLAATIDWYAKTSPLSQSFHDRWQLYQIEEVREVLAGEIRDRFLHDEPRHENLPPEDRDKWIGIINVALFAIPRGLAGPEIRSLLNEHVEGQEFSSTEYDRLHQVILRVLPGFDELLADNTIDDVCHHLKVDPMTLIREIDSRNTSLETAQTAMLNFVFGWSESPVIRDALLAILPPDSENRQTIEDDSSRLDAQVLWGFPTTPAGQFGLPAYGTQSRSVEFQQRADEVVKRVAFELVAAGFALCAIDGSEFLLQVEDDGEKTRRRIKSILRSAASSVVPKVLFECRVVID